MAWQAADNCVFCSLVCRTFDSSLAEVCWEEGVGLLAYSPLAMGLLTVRPALLPFFVTILLHHFSLLPAVFHCQSVFIVVSCQFLGNIILCQYS